jgi:4-hydroxy-tetrahydrodipicolinate synthase
MMLNDSSTPPSPSLLRPTPPSASAKLAGLWIPLITPFLADQSVDQPALVALLNHYNAMAIAGLVINGTTGEPSSLSHEEQMAHIDLALAHRQDKRVIAGISCYALEPALASLRALNQRPITAVLVSAPAYTRPCQAGLIDWFTRQASASDHPLVIYDIPYRSGVRIERDTLLRLADHPNIVAVKDCSGDLAKTLAMIHHGGLEVLAGDDLQLFSCLAQGGSGAISASAHLRTDEFLSVIEALSCSDLKLARQRWQSLVPWIEAAFKEPNPGPVKAALADQGWISNVLRPPMQAC